MGRKVIHIPTPELLESICEQIANGKSLRRICSDAGMPSVSTVCNWLGEDAAFAKRYARAREQQSDHFVDEMVEIADNAEDAQKARLQIDTRKWIASKMRPKVYGDKLGLDHSGSVTVAAGPLDESI
jgi:hypothetical protein